jgi:signal transduction histidine kinase
VSAPCSDHLEAAEHKRMAEELHDHLDFGLSAFELVLATAAAVSVLGGLYLWFRSWGA